MHSKPSLKLRQQLLIDPHVQGSLLRRIALYSLACLIYFIVILVFTETMSDPRAPLSEAVCRCLDEAIYWGPGLMLLLPIVAYDLLKFSNRFAGPVFRLRREMRRLIDGESVRPLNFRDEDCWMEMADLFNQLRDELMELRQARTDQSKVAGNHADVVSQPQLFTEDSDEKEPAEDLFVSSSR